MKYRNFSLFSAALLLVLPLSEVNAFGQARAVLTRHVREITRTGEAQPIGQLPADQIMNLDLVLPIRDQAGLEQFLKEVYDPASPSYRQFLTVSRFTERFGPSQEDYYALVRFAKQNGFTVVGGTRDGMEVRVTGPVSAVETAFHVSMRTYPHPTENRNFYAPDREPTANLQFPLWHISGLDNFSTPHSALVSKPDYEKAHGVNSEGRGSLATSGSGPSASFLGSDMRAAYYGGTALTGAGQNLGLFEWQGTNLADLNTYFKNVGQTNHVPITLLSTDGSSTDCTAPACTDDTEQTIDMTQAIGMAPGLASLVVYIGGSDVAVVSAMTTHNPLPTTIGCSAYWWPADPTSLDPYFERMEAQGQTFFAASGDKSTWSSSIHPFPADDAHVVAVGGTDLTTKSAGGAWKSETAWGGSGGGISPDNISIPGWQLLPGVINAGNGGSLIYRNGPDVSANANQSFYTCANQSACLANYWGGTSFAAPMWAGYIALVNQQLVENGKPTIGFLNPTIYAQNTQIVMSSYAADFHDITSGTSGSYSATTGYDLVTGWGSPNAGLINALAQAPASSTISIYRYTGTPCSGSSCTGWSMVDNNQTTVAIAASGSDFYQLHNNGEVYKLTGAACNGTSCSGWTKFDNNPATVAIAADGSNLYELHNDGKIFQSTGVDCNGSSCTGWTEIDANPTAVAIAAADGTLYELHSNGGIYQWIGVACSSNACTGWIKIDNNPAAIAIVADGANLYELHDNGEIYKATGATCSGTSCSGWTKFDNNPAAVAIAASGGNLYELHNNGEIYQSTGTPCNGSSCSGWIKLDNNASAIAIVADGNNLYELHYTGGVYQFTGVACSGSSCPGWSRVDDNTLTIQIAAGGGQLYQLHGHP
jgi:subtilase family serine protease